MNSHKKGQLMASSLSSVLIIALLLAVYFFIKLRHDILSTLFFILVSF